MFGFFSSNSPSVAYDPAEAVRRAAAGEITLVDIRDGAEVMASGKAKGALHVPLAALRMKADPASPECLPEFRAGKPVVLYCASGGRSQMAARMLRQMGLNEVYNLGGLAHWQMAGGAIAR
ncbi:rhodanese-like domain-containing protein [Nioella nitratireducens]|uniref:rhodanese-like domain-containing protein n=1 Tax=Nioella nitratireducens TaxID=1287720 RepID=UPI0008FD0888|nr:rhodanese-like domain-containing protein [Nioella nitratireducens]